MLYGGFRMNKSRIYKKIKKGGTYLYTINT